MMLFFRCPGIGGLTPKVTQLIDLTKQLPNRERNEKPEMMFTFLKGDGRGDVRIHACADTTCNKSSQL